LGGFGSQTARSLLAGGLGGTFSFLAESASDRHGFMKGIGAMRPDVVFTVIFRKDGEFLAAPTVLGEFGRELCVEIPELMRAQVMAMAPNQEGRSFTIDQSLFHIK
jgi:hypothetical protein